MSSLVEDAMAECQHFFVADVAHQIRTQLQLVGIRLERLASHVTADGDPAYERLGADIARLRSTLDEFLEFNRVIEGGVPAEIDIRPVVRDRYEAWSDPAMRHGVTLRSRLDDAVVIQARHGVLEQALDILLDNAVKNAPAGSLITLDLRTAGDQVTVHVVDQGPGMTAEERASASRRGWRGGWDAGGTKGWGLGLSIANRLALLGGGRLGLEPGPGGRGLDAHLTFPLAAQLGSGPAC